jgi:thiamine-phosphate pyrophosphorylase
VNPVFEALVQYRNKGASPELRRGQAQALLTVCRARRRPFNVNDFVDLCMALDADGVRVGGMDAPLTQVRSALGPDKIVGASCYGD